MKNKKFDRLQKLVKSCPITIVYGCHTIELREDSYSYNGYTFDVEDAEGKGLTIKIIR